MCIRFRHRFIINVLNLFRYRFCETQQNIDIIFRQVPRTKYVFCQCGEACSLSRGVSSCQLSPVGVYTYIYIYLYALISWPRTTILTFTFSYPDHAPRFSPLRSHILTMHHNSHLCVLISWPCTTILNFTFSYPDHAPPFSPLRSHILTMHHHSQLERWIYLSNIQQSEEINRVNWFN